MAQVVFEGTWEEVSRKAEGLSGRRVRLTVLPDEAAPALDAPLYKGATPAERIQALDRLAARNRHLPVLPPEAFERESLYEDR